MSYIYLLLASRKGITNIRKRVTIIKERVTNINERVTGDATYISGKHWQQTLANIGKQWRTINIGAVRLKGLLRRMLTNIGEELQMLGSGENLVSKI